MVMFEGENMSGNMTNGNFFKKIILFTIPVMLGSVFQLLFNTCDLIVVGKFAGDRSLAAVGSTSSLINLITNIFIGFSIGANVVIGAAIGKGDDEECEKSVHTSILFSLLCGIGLMIFGFFTSRIWLEMMDTNSESIDKATTYLKIYFLGSAFNLVYNFGAAILRSVGETKRPLIYLTIAGILNALLNLLFVIVFKMDVAGVAIATIISQGISAVLIIIDLMKYDGPVRLYLHKLHIYPRELGRIVLVGLPAGIQSSLISASNVFIQSAVNSFDNNSIVAGNTASANVEGFVWTSMNSFYQACISFTSQNYGARKLKNCKKILLICASCACVTGIILGGLAYLLRRPLIGLYVSSDNAVKYGTLRLTIICLSYCLCGIMDVPVGGLRGLKKSTVPMIVSIIGMVGFRILWLSTVFRVHHKLWIIYISYPISWILTASVHYICYAVIYKKYRHDPLFIENEPTM